MRRKVWFALAVALQIAVLLTMMGMKWSTLTYGTKVILKTAPVDPWDVFRGDYVTLNYEISTIDLNSVRNQNETYKRNDTVYVTLVPRGRYYVASAVSSRRPEGGKLFIKGLVNNYDDYNQKLFVSYGIDSYYVPQHQGEKIQNNGRRASLEVEVSIDSKGESALSRLFMEGKELKFE